VCVCVCGYMHIPVRVYMCGYACVCVVIRVVNTCMCITAHISCTTHTRTHQTTPIHIVQSYKHTHTLMMNYTHFTTHIHPHAHSSLHTDTCTLKHTLTHTHTHTHTHTLTHTHTHTRTHTHIHSPELLYSPRNLVVQSPLSQLSPSDGMCE
jgi:hypothetical protein